MTTSNGGQQDRHGPTADALSLPAALSKVKPTCAPQGEFTENIIAEFQKNGREKLVVSRSAASWGGVFCCVRFWERSEDGAWRASKRGINLRADFVEQVAAAMVEAVKP